MVRIYIEIIIKNENTDGVHRFVCTERIAQVTTVRS
jgi:hypothetical protein